MTEGDRSRDGWKRPGQDAEAVAELADQIRELVAELRAARKAPEERTVWTAEGRRLFWVTAWATLAGALAAAMLVGYAIAAVRANSLFFLGLPFLQIISVVAGMIFFIVISVHDRRNGIEDSRRRLVRNCVISVGIGLSPILIGTLAQIH